MSVHERGKGNWYAVFYVNGKQQWRSLPDCKNKTQAKAAHAALIAERESGALVLTAGTTLADWVAHWVSVGCPGTKHRRKVNERTVERYHELLRCHVLPTLGARPLQQIQSTEIDALYTRLGKKLAARTCRHVHSTLGACLGTAARTRKIARNPMSELVWVPVPPEADHGMALDADQLRTLVQGFEGTVLHPIVVLAAYTGARRNEILALQWGDFDPAKKTLRIERAIDETRAHGLKLKGPKTERGKRTIQIDDDLVALLVKLRERHLRLVAGVPDGLTVNLALVKLPDGALMFPNSPAPGEDFSFTKLRNPRNMTKEFVRRARALGFRKLRFHDLRGTHETLLLDQGVPVHVVAARCGHDPATMLRSYAKRTRKADTSAAGVIGSILKGTLG